MKLLGHLIIAIAWCIPGRAHRWAVRLRAERKAAIEAARRTRRTGA